jgi:hypothetical protein
VYRCILNLQILQYHCIVFDKISSLVWIGIAYSAVRGPHTRQLLDSWGSFEIGEVRILTPIGRTLDRAAQYSAEDDTNSTRMRIFPANIEDNIFIEILYTHFCTI